MHSVFANFAGIILGQSRLDRKLDRMQLRHVTKVKYILAIVDLCTFIGARFSNTRIHTELGTRSLGFAFLLLLASE